MTSCNSCQYLGKILLRYPWRVDPGTLLLIILNVLSCQMEQAEIHVAQQNLLLAEVHNEKDFLIEQKLQWVYIQYMNIVII